MTEGPLIVQSDKTLLLDIDHPLSTECRRAIAPFAELERSPEHIHTYRLTNLGLWNARAAGHDAENVIECQLTKASNFLKFEFTGIGTEKNHLKEEQDKEELEEKILLFRKNNPTASLREMANHLGTNAVRVMRTLKRNNLDCQ